jgi:uncharacterized protein YceH (UPF0502 family)
MFGLKIFTYHLINILLLSGYNTAAKLKCKKNRLPEASSYAMLSGLLDMNADIFK